MIKRIIAIAVSLLVLALIWIQVDPAAIWDAATRVSPAWFWAAVLFNIPLSLATAQRFRVLSHARISLGYSVRLILAASTLNMVLPSKMGDIAKAWILKQRNAMTGSQALALVVLEKLLDFWSLLLVGCVALVLYGPAIPGLPLVALFVGAGAAGLLLLLLPSRTLIELLRSLVARVPRIGAKADGLLAEWQRLIRSFWASPARATGILAASVLLWVGHMFQIWLFARSIGDIPMGMTMALGAVAILAGLLPLTFAGVGVRDAAMVVLFSAYLQPGGAALLGVFATLRYLVPALAGLPFVSDFWNARPTDQAAP